MQETIKELVRDRRSTVQKMVTIVDGTLNNKETINEILNPKGFSTQFYENTQAFISMPPTLRCDIVVLSVGNAGLGILRQVQMILSHRIAMPIFLLCESEPGADFVVRSMRQGVVSVLVKPLTEIALMSEVLHSVRKDNSRTPTHNRQTAATRLSALTTREKEVIALLAQGKSNREAATDLGISHRTVEIHRAHCMSKLAARNAADLVRIFLSR